jgi:hypothetical protein
MSDTRFIITTTLEGYINALVPSGKFNNCTFGFKVPDEFLPKFEDAYQKALEWGKNKMAGKRFSAELPKWDEEGSLRLAMVVIAPLLCSLGWIQMGCPLILTHRSGKVLLLS